MSINNKDKKKTKRCYNKYYNKNQKKVKEQK